MILILSWPLVEIPDISMAMCRLVGAQNNITANFEYGNPELAN